MGLISRPVEPTVTGVGVIDKAARILSAVEDKPLDLTSLIVATRLPRATAHRLAVALEGHGLLRRDAEGRFAPGLRLVALGRAASTALHLPEVARPALEALRDAQKTADIATLEKWVKGGAPWPKLDNEKPKGETVDYDELVKRWKS